MRLATVTTEHGPTLAFEIDAGFFTFQEAINVLGANGWRPGDDAHRSQLGAPPDPAVLGSIHSLLDGGEPALRFASAVVEEFLALGAQGADFPPPLREDVLLAPIVRPRKNVFCVGRNYADHAKERGADVPQDPVFFTKAPTTVVGPDAEVPLPPQTAQFDYEGELAVIIGKKGRDIPKEKANEYIFGYTIVNDLTARDLQSRHLQFFKGKSLDRSCPMGPVIVTADEAGELTEATIETRVNGEVRQSARLSQMIFDVPTLIAVLSDGLTLEPGDIIATGTPSGVGSATGRFLAKGDVVTVTITSLGTLTTYIV